MPHPRQSRLVIGAKLFSDLVAELARRGEGRRESGAFLLTDRAHPADVLPQPVSAIAFYDDLDPECLTGGITFHANGYTALNAVCRRDGVRVVGDIHTHPGRIVHQSCIDAASPMAAVDGHVALIAPAFAVGVTGVTELGVHVRRDGLWTSHFGDDTTSIIHIRLDRRRLTAWVRQLWTSTIRHATKWPRPTRTQ